MNIDFALILVILTVVSGGILLVDKLGFASRRKRAKQANEAVKEPKLVEYARSFFPVFLIVLVLRSFLVEPYRIPTGSLEPSLLTGDFILVNKFQYGLRWPVINKTIIPIGEPKRGDIAVFFWPKDTSINYVKRVVGLPGDTVEYRDKQLFINGKPVPREFVRYTTNVDAQGKPWRVAEYKEVLDGVEYSTYDRTDVPGRRFRFTVPQGMYFTLGDNRDDSSDSRYWGAVSEDLLLGKVFMVFMSWDKFAKTIRWHRIGEWVE